MKSFAKLNIFLKITGRNDRYHQILSRFILFDKLFDTLEFIQESKNSNKLKIYSNISLPSSNTLTKTCEILYELGFKRQLECFFKEFSLVIKKNIPLGSGLGGGSSNASTFLKMLNFNLNLGLNQNELLEISSKIGADVSFFTSGFKSANVSGYGEIIERFDDEIPKISLNLKNIKCETKNVFECFKKFYKISDIKFANSLLELKSDEILKNFTNLDLNDLLAPVIKEYNLKIRDDEFLSGSGSTTFEVVK